MDSLKCYEYEWFFDESKGRLTCKRHGLEWRNETGDGAILALLQVALDFRDKVATARAEALRDAADRVQELKSHCVIKFPSDYESGILDGYNNALDAILTDKQEGQ